MRQNKITYILFLLLISTTFAFSQNYKQVKIYINSLNDVQTLYNTGMQFDHLQYTKDNAMVVFISDNDYAILQRTGFRYEILIDDWYSFYNNRRDLTESEKAGFINKSKREMNVSGFGFGSMGGYYTLSEVIAELDSMKMLYPNLITSKISIGNSVQGRPTYMVKISDNPDIDEDEPEVLYTGLHHAREPEGIMLLIYYMYYLLENYYSDPSVQYLVDHRELYFIPVVNPDGYEYNRQTNPNGGGMWRKNRKNNGDGSYGIDLNRNYGPYAYWNAPNGGSSTYTWDDTYRGTAPFSEPETAHIRDFIAAHHIRCILNYHTYGNYLIYPYGALSMETPDSAIFREYSRDMTTYNGYFAGLDLEAVGYSTRGNSDDYAYDGDIIMNHGKIFAMTPEVGTTGFWPSQSEIFPLAMENVYPNLYYAWIGGEYVSMISPNFNKQYFNPGDEVLMNPVLKNKGLSTGHNISLELSSLNSYASVINSQADFDSIQSRQTATVLTPLSFSVSPSAPAEAEIQLVLNIKTNGITVSKDTLNLIVGVPMFVFADTTNNPNILWTITGTPVSAPKWAITTASYNSPPNSYTDSPAGNYSANSTITMTLTNPINLTGYSNPRLTFYTRFDIENDWDYGQVKISTNNGSTWIPLAGEYTNPGTGSFQPNGEPLYDGTQSTWVREEIPLSGYISSQFKIKFELKSDVSVQRDGWYVDDIAIIYYGLNYVDLSPFTALIEGFYDGVSMIPDTVTVELHNASSPLSITDHAKILLDNNGLGSARFFNAVRGTPYYIVVKHRNAVETWSAQPQTFASGILSYDFTSSIDKAYGNNLKFIGGKWCLFGGDINQDGFVNATDLVPVFINNVNGLTGYIATDLNGDMYTEIEDLNLVFTNNILGVERKLPPGYFSIEGNKIRIK